MGLLLYRAIKLILGGNYSLLVLALARCYFPWVPWYGEVQWRLHVRDEPEMNPPTSGAKGNGGPWWVTELKYPRTARTAHEPRDRAVCPYAPRCVGLLMCILMARPRTLRAAHEVPLSPHLTCTCLLFRVA